MFEKEHTFLMPTVDFPIYIGDIIPERAKLFVQTPENFKLRFNVDVRTNEEVVSIDRENKSVVVKRLIDDTYYTDYITTSWFYLRSGTNKATIEGY